MKKFLSLVLALVMTMSLVTIGAGAKDFTDNSKITYEEAVAVVSEIGVVDGYTDGSFNPTNQLTRGAAAKIICNLILGPTTASALSADAAPFSDVPTTNEFAGYIAYCSQQGIINGYNDGTFRPAAPLTGYAFLKMLLGALGYDGEVEGFTGPNWSIQVGKLALGIGLVKGNDDFVGTQYVNREEACLYAFNTLKADMVEYDAKTSVSIGGAEVVIAGSKAQKILQSESGYDNTLNDGGVDTQPVLQFAEKYFSKLTRTRNNTDNFGRPANEWKYKSVVIGTYVDDSDLIATYTAKAPKGELYDLVGSGTVKGFTAARDPYSLSVWVDGEEVKEADDANTQAIVDTYFLKNSTGAAGAVNGHGTGVTGNGVLTEVYMDDNNNVTIVIINTWLVKATADYNSTKETLNIEAIENNEGASVMPPLGTSIDNDDVYVADFNEDDYILVTYSYMSRAIESAQLAETVTGEVSEYTEKENVIIDGTKYSYNKLVGEGTENEKGVEYTIGEDAVVVMDAYGYIIYVDESVSTSSYVWIQESAGASGLEKSAIAMAYFADGTYDEIAVAKVTYLDGGDSTTVKNGDCIDVLNAENGWYTFSKTSADKYNLSSTKLITDDADIADLSAEPADEQIVYNDKVKFLGTDVDVKANSSTVMVVIDEDGEPTVYTGVENIPDITVQVDGEGDVISTGSARIEWVESTTGYAKYVVVDLSDATDVSVDDQAVADYLFLLKPTANKTVSGENTYYQYKVILDGEEMTKYIEDTIVDGNQRGDLFYSVKENSKGYITGAKTFGSKGDTQIAEEMEGALIDFSGDTLTLDDDTDYELIVPTGTKTYLVIGAGVDELLKDVDADYETYLAITARALAGIVKNYAVDGWFYADLDDEDKDVVTALYVYISDAVPTDPDEEEPTDLEAALADAIDEVAAAEYSVNGDVDGVSASAVRTKVATDAEAAITPVEGLTFEATAAIKGSYTAPVLNGSTEVDVEITVTVTDDETDDTASASTTVTVIVDGVTE